MIRRGSAPMAAAALAISVLVAGCSAVSSEAPTAAGPGSVPGSTPGSVGTSAPVVTPAPATTTSLPPPLPAPSFPIASPGSNKLFVLGDSVILGAKNTIPKELVGWDVTFDARESRFITQGLDVLKAHKHDADNLATLYQADLEQAYKDAGKEPPKPPPALSVIDVLGRVVVINLCTNYEAGGGFAGHIDKFMDYLKGADRVVWVTCVEWSPGQTEANAAIRDAAGRYPNIVVADWASFSPTPGYTYDDNIHLREAGQDEMAKLVARAVGPAPTPNPPAPTTTRPKPTIPPTTQAPDTTVVPD